MMFKLTFAKNGDYSNYKGYIEVNRCSLVLQKTKHPTCAHEAHTGRNQFG